MIQVEYKRYGFSTVLKLATTRLQKLVIRLKILRIIIFSMESRNSHALAECPAPRQVENPICETILESPCSLLNVLLSKLSDSLDHLAHLIRVQCDVTSELEDTTRVQDLPESQIYLTVKEITLDVSEPKMHSPSSVTVSVIAFDQPLAAKSIVTRELSMPLQRGRIQFTATLGYDPKGGTPFDS